MVGTYSIISYINADHESTSSIILEVSASNLDTPTLTIK